MSAQALIVDDGRANAQILITRDAPRMVNLAAGELQKYIKKISSAELPVVNTPGTGHPVTIYVGKSEYTDQLGITDEGLKYGAFRMISGPDYLILLGHDFDYVLKGPVPMEPWPESITEAQREWDEMTGSFYQTPMMNVYKSYHEELGFWEYDEGGSLNAVYEFLRMLGVRWYMPGELGEVVPGKTSISIPSVSKTVKPDYKLRHIQWSWFRTATREDVLWERRIGLNSVYEVLGQGRHIHGMRHIQGRDEMQAAHPEYYALRDGKRDTVFRGHGHACFSSEGLFQETVDYVRAVYDDFGMPAVSLWPMDGYKQCECELCREKSPSELVWGFVDRVAREVYEYYPNRLITCGAYADYRDPPGNIAAFSPNVAVFISNCGRPFMDDPEQWSWYSQLIEGWQERIAPGNIIRLENNLYTFKLGGRPYDEPTGFAMIFPRAMAKDLQALKGISLGDWGEVCRTTINTGSGNIYTWKAPELDHLNIYVQSRYLWDAGQDIDALLNEYYALFYGPAGNKMKAAFEYAEANREYAKNHFFCFKNPVAKNCRLEDPDNIDLSVRNHLLELLNTAREEAGGTIYGKRIQLIIDELKTYEKLLTVVNN